MKQINQCPRCGGKLIKVGKGYKCEFCDALFEEERVNSFEEEMRALLDGLKQEKIANLRQRLWEATHDKYLSKDKIVSIAREIRNYLPDDVLANFYEIANTCSQNELNEFLSNLDVKEDAFLVDVILDYMLRTLEMSNLLALNNLIEKAYKQREDLKLYDKYTTLLSKEAEKLKEGVYELNLTRNVFVAYSSADMKYVEEVVKVLEDNNITCFVAMRNLRHGAGAKEYYDINLEKAMDNSQIFLLISSTNSRSVNCDAFTKEIPYIKKQDIQNAPAEYRSNYAKIPLKYKKPRIQLIVGEKPKDTITDRIVGEFFNGCEWRYSAEEVAESVIRMLMESPEEESQADIIKKELEEKQAKQQEELKQMISSLKDEITTGSSAKDAKNYNDFSYSDDDTTITKYSGFSSIVDVPNGVKKIGDHAFLNNNSITEVVLPDSVTEIGNFAFSGCGGLEKIRLSNNLEKIGEYSFVGCYKLRNLYIPESVKYIESDAFSSLSNLSITCGHTAMPSTWNQNWAGTSSKPKIIFKESNDKPVDPFTLSEDKTSLISYNLDEDEVVVPDGITDIKKSAFVNKKMSKIVLPKSLRIIDDLSFVSCKSLKTVEFMGTFKDWVYLKSFDSIQIDNLLIDGRHINKNIRVGFSGINKRRDVMDEEGVIFLYKFQGRNELEMVDCKDAFYIGKQAFANCKNLKFININGATEIGSSAFYGCSNLREVYLPYDLKSIGDNAFDTGGEITLYTERKSPLPEWSKNWLGNNKKAKVVWGCTKSASEIFGEDLLYFSLDEIDLLEEVVPNSDNIYNIYNLDHSDLLKKREDKKKIEKNNEQEELDEIKKKGLKQNFSNFDEHIEDFKKVYNSHPDLLGISNDFDLNEKNYYVSNTGELFMYEGNSDSLKAPKKVKSVQKQAFRYTKQVRQIYFENDKIDYIGDEAFADSKVIEQIVIPKGTKVGKRVFSNSPKVKIYCEDLAYEDGRPPLNFDRHWLDGNDSKNVIWGFDWAKVKEEPKATKKTTTTNDYFFNNLYQPTKQTNTFSGASATELYNNGIKYRDGKGVYKDYKKAFDYFYEAANKGLKEAQNEVGFAYFKGEGVRQSDVEAVKWFEKAALQNHVPAQLNLASCYEMGRGVPKDMTKVFYWYKMAAQNGSASAMNRTGKNYEKGYGVYQNINEAINWYIKACKLNYGPAFTNLGYICLNGTGVPANSYQAAQYFQQGANAGDIEAKFALGCCYLRGIGVMPNSQLGLYYVREAANQGFEPAIDLLRQLTYR